MQIWLNSPYGFMTTSIGKIKNGTEGFVDENDFSTTKKVPVSFEDVVVEVPPHWLDTPNVIAKKVNEVKKLYDTLD